MAEGKKKQKKSPWWYKLGILVFGAVFCVSAFMDRLLPVFCPWKPPALDVGKIFYSSKNVVACPAAQTT